MDKSIENWCSNTCFNGHEELDIAVNIFFFLSIGHSQKQKTVIANNVKIYGNCLCNSLRPLWLFTIELAVRWKQKKMWSFWCMTRRQWRSPRMLSNCCSSTRTIGHHTMEPGTRKWLVSRPATHGKNMRFAAHSTFLRLFTSLVKCLKCWVFASKCERASGRAASVSVSYFS